MAAVCISRRQQAVHIATEVLSVGVAVPIFIYAATRSELPRWVRIVSGVMAGAGILIDGGLLLRWATRKG